jgi:Protein of unknown function (DUF1579)
MPDEPEQAQKVPTPGPALKRLDRLVGTWDMTGRTLDSEADNVFGRTTFSWVPGGFFLEQRVAIDFLGTEIEALEVIGYDPETDTFPSTVYSGFSPSPLPYRWTLEGDSLRISVSYGALDASFEGTFSEAGRVFAGGWRPNPGADQTINVPYDISARRTGE